MEATCAALVAAAARGNDAESDVVARRDVLDSGADRLDDAGALVTHDHRPAPLAELAVGKSHVRVADACRDDSNEDLVVPRWRELDLLDDEWLSRLVEDGRADPHQPIR